MTAVILLRLTYGFATRRIVAWPPSARPVRFAYESCVGVVGGRHVARATHWRHANRHAGDLVCHWRRRIHRFRTGQGARRPSPSGLRPDRLGGGGCARAPRRWSARHGRPAGAGGVAGRGGHRLGLPCPASRCIWAAADSTTRRIHRTGAGPDGCAPARRRGRRRNAPGRVCGGCELVRRDGRTASNHGGRAAAALGLGALSFIGARAPRGTRPRRAADRRRVPRVGLRQRRLVSRTASSSRS